MNWRLAVFVALCGTFALAGWLATGLAGLGSLGIESTEAPIAREAAGSLKVDNTGVNAALSDLPSMPQPAAPPTLFAAVSPTDPVQDTAKPADRSQSLDACTDGCIDQYLWSLYERTPKVDTVKLEERI